MVPYFKALNYIYLQDRSAAQVEARRASLLLSKYVDATLSGVRDEDGDELRQISNNAFLHYYSGMLYDWDGEINDAFTAYRNAAVAYQQNHDLLQEEIPPSLGRDIDRVAMRLGFRQELIDLRKSCGDVFAADDSADFDLPGTRQDYQEAARGGWQSGHGEVVLLIETGFVPKKTQFRFGLPDLRERDLRRSRLLGLGDPRGTGQSAGLHQGPQDRVLGHGRGPRAAGRAGTRGRRAGVGADAGRPRRGRPGVESVAGGAHHLSMPRSRPSSSRPSRVA